VNGPSRLVAGTGTLPRIAEVLAPFRPRRVLLVGSDAAVRRTGIRRFLPADTCTFSGFRPNPRLEDVLEGCAVAARYRPDAVVGVGGGSSMDTAKLVRILPPGDVGRQVVLRGTTDLLRRDVPPLVLVPTVSGTGSEVTRFATVYADGRKYSVDHERVLPTASVVDPELAAGCPSPVAFSCVLDAFAHAVESYWSLRSTPGSRALAAQALTALRRVAVAGRPLSPSSRARVAEAAVQAGRAIDITRTTAAHAFAYPTTVHFGVPHGLACALHLIWLLDHLATRAETACADPRGADFVTARLGEIAALLGADHPKRSARTLEALVTRTGFSPRLGSYGVTPPALPALTTEALTSIRASNLPVHLGPDTALTALRERL
jgi:alcohol dehydrogenase